ncbi:EboA domain-containing protein [Kribbella sp. NPDC051620]|uniref:EboA domain-containing protein n=1 Tax=Kribbella sp. NPDC051620 TaxID=3364120 RepID=UPI00378BA41F
MTGEMPPGAAGVQWEAGTSAVELEVLLPVAARVWLAGARQQPLATSFPAAARKVGHGRLSPAWTADQAVRALLLIGAPADEVLAVYRYGDTAEKLAVLHALSVADVADALQDQAIPIVEDALRTNDQRLVAAALGPYATRYLSQHAFRHAVLKCVFANIPLAVVDGLPKRVDPELIRMMTDFAAERSAAGRAIPTDLEAYLNSPP